MALTVDDIYDKEFKTVGNNGYSADDVDQFLDSVCDEMLNREEATAKLQERIADLENELAACKAAAAAPRVNVQQNAAQAANTADDFLKTAQQMADQKLEDARQEAEEIIARAHKDADQLLENARQEQGSLDDKLADMRRSVKDYKQLVLAFLDNQKKALEEDELLKD